MTVNEVKRKIRKDEGSKWKEKRGVVGSIEKGMAMYRKGEEEGKGKRKERKGRMRKKRKGSLKFELEFQQGRQEINRRNQQVDLNCCGFSFIFGF